MNTLVPTMNTPVLTMNTPGANMTWPDANGDQGPAVLLAAVDSASLYNSYREAVAMRRAILALIALLIGVAEARAVDYAELRAQAVKTCEAIDASESRSGLLFNPDGYRSFYVRSQCFQEAAIQFRDTTLCRQVRRRWSLFSSSWGYTADRCRQLVAEGMARDRVALEEMKRAYVAGGIKMRDFRIVRNGNGRDFDIYPTFTGTYATGYMLTFEILPGGSGPAFLLHRLGYHVDETSNLNIYVPQADIRQRFPAFTMNRSYTVRGTVTFDMGFGGQSGYWSPEFIERVFPLRERSQSITREIGF